MRKLAFLPVLALTLTACGTLFNGSSQDIRFDSNIKGVQIMIDGLRICKTPCTYTLERRSSPLTITARKQGYEEQVTVLKSELSKKSIINLSMWPSWLTDLASGGMWQYNRSGVYIEMEPERRYPYGQYGRYSQNEKKNREIRRFSLFNYQALKSEAMENKSGEYIKTLAELSGKDEQSLINTINDTNGEVNLAHVLTGIE